jgi:hypothetical protein
VKEWSVDLSRRVYQRVAVTVRVAVRVEVLALEEDRNETDGVGREQDSGGRWEREQRGPEWNEITGEWVGRAAAAAEEGVGSRGRYDCTQED